MKGVLLNKNNVDIIIKAIEIAWIDDIGITPTLVVYHSWCFCSNVYHSCCTCNPQKGEENTERWSNNRLEDKEKCASCENCRLKNNFGKRLDWPILLG